MSEQIISVLVVPLWLASSLGWASWVATYAVLTPWRFLP